MKTPRMSMTAFPEKAYAVTLFEEFLGNSTYLFLRTHDAEGHYSRNPKLSSSLNIMEATARFLGETLTAARIAALRKYWEENFSDETRLAPVHSYEFQGYEGHDAVFRITESGSNLMSVMSALAFTIRAGIQVDFGFRQKSKATRNASGDIHRLAFPVGFEGKVVAGTSYVVFDDHIRTGSTVANLAGHVHHAGGQVDGVISLSNNPLLQSMRPTGERLARLYAHSLHAEIDRFWRDRFGYGLDCLTDEECRMLEGLLEKHNEKLTDEIMSYMKDPAPPFYPKPGWWSEDIESPETYALGHLGIDTRLVILPRRA